MTIRFIEEVALLSLKDRIVSNSANNESRKRDFRYKVLYMDWREVWESWSNGNFAISIFFLICGTKFQRP
jgi:hypothetical protein